LYLYIDYPTFEREVEIVKSHTPEASIRLIKSVVKAIQKIRKLNLTKNPSIRATVDWVRSLMIFNTDDLDKDSLEKTINVVIKNEDDRKKVLDNLKLK
jgi:MoxR-like ATPase